SSALRAEPDVLTCTLLFYNREVGSLFLACKRDLVDLVGIEPTPPRLRRGALNSAVSTCRSAVEVNNVISSFLAVARVFELRIGFQTAPGTPISTGRCASRLCLSTLMFFKSRQWPLRTTNVEPLGTLTLKNVNSGHG